MDQLSLFEVDNLKTRVLKIINNKKSKYAKLAWMNSMGSEKSRFNDGYLKCLMDMEKLFKEN